MSACWCLALGNQNKISQVSWENRFFSRNEESSYSRITDQTGHPNYDAPAPAMWTMVPSLTVAIGTVIGPELVLSISSPISEREFRTFVDNTVLAVVQDWDSRELINRIDPEMLRPGDEQEVENLFRLYRKLGDLVEYYGAEGEVWRDSSESGAVGFSYFAEADFENGSATVKVEGIHKDGNSYILDFNMRSEAFIAELIDH